jgi:hypothetical protein
LAALLITRKYCVMSAFLEEIRAAGTVVRTVAWTLGAVAEVLREVGVELYLDPESDPDARDLVLAACAGGVVGGIGGTLVGCALATRIAAAAAAVGWWCPGPGWVVAALGFAGLGLGAVAAAVAAGKAVRVRVLAKRDGDRLRLEFAEAA